MIFRRLKNLWRLSAFIVEDKKEPTLKKDFSTVEHKLATIIKEKSEELFPEDGETA